MRLPAQAIESIGLTPDGKFLVIKTNGVSKTVGLESVLEFSDMTSSAQELIQTIEPIAVFASVVNGQTEYVLPDRFTGPAELDLKYQLIDNTLNAVVTGSRDNDFIKLSNDASVGKAVNGGGGNDVIDGGVGSTFISGGGGSNTFFLDGRASGVSWSTITDFSIGTDKATVWGWKQGGPSQISRQGLSLSFGGMGAQIQMA
jgi:serralysin